MKRKRYRKGDRVGRFLSFVKEVYPTISNSGKTKKRNGFFECLEHPGTYFKVSMDKASDYKRTVCLCETQFNGETVHEPYTKAQVDDYSFSKAQRWHEKQMKDNDPRWFKVTRFGIFLLKQDGRSFQFYSFEKTDRSGQDYKTARKLENSIWNRPKKNKAFYLFRLSHELDALHRSGKITFNSDVWNRGAGLEVFNGLLKKHKIV